MTETTTTELRCVQCNGVIQQPEKQLEMRMGYTWHRDCLPQGVLEKPEKREEIEPSELANYEIVTAFDLLNPIKFYLDRDRRKRIAGPLVYNGDPLGPGETSKQVLYFEFDPPNPELLGKLLGLFVYRDAHLVDTDPLKSLPPTMQWKDWASFDIRWTGREKPPEQFLMAEILAPYEVWAPARMKLVTREKIELWRRRQIDETQT